MRGLRYGLRQFTATAVKEHIRSQIEDKESALGRPLNEDEMVALLRQTGHPLWVAARYQPQQSLIGPALFPPFHAPGAYTNLMIGHGNKVRLRIFMQHFIFL